MLIAKVENNVVVSCGEHNEIFPNTSFGDVLGFITEKGYSPVENNVSYDNTTHKLVETAPYIENGSVLTVKAVEMDNAEKEELKSMFGKSVRLVRNQKLKDSDWTQLADATLSAETIQQWATYRQSLRDIPLQASFPFSVEWPVNPNGDK